MIIFSITSTELGRIKQFQSIVELVETGTFHLTMEEYFNKPLWFETGKTIGRKTREVSSLRNTTSNFYGPKEFDFRKLNVFEKF